MHIKPWISCSYFGNFIFWHRGAIWSSWSTLDGPSHFQGLAGRYRNVFWWLLMPRYPIRHSPTVFYADEYLEKCMSVIRQDPRNQRKSWKNRSSWTGVDHLSRLTWQILVWGGSYMVAGTSETIETCLFYLPRVDRSVWDQPVASECPLSEPRC